MHIWRSKVSYRNRRTRTQDPRDKRPGTRRDKILELFQTPSLLGFHFVWGSCSQTNVWITSKKSFKKCRSVQACQDLGRSSLRKMRRFKIRSDHPSGTQSMNTAVRAFLCLESGLCLVIACNYALNNKVHGGEIEAKWLVAEFAQTALPWSSRSFSPSAAVCHASKEAICFSDTTECNNRMIQIFGIYVFRRRMATGARWATDLWKDVEGA